ncbi:MAG: hypothetical protein NVS1B7_5110 [Candidatus Saccharimonadales bacterium]
MDIAYSTDLGIKSGQYSDDARGHHLLINQKFSHNNYVVIAVIGHEIARYVTQNQLKTQLSTAVLSPIERVDLAAIYLGLGLLIINGLNYADSWLDRFHRRIVSSYGATILDSYTATEFAYQLGHYVAISPMLSAQDLYRQLAPWSRHFYSDTHTVRSIPARHVRDAQRQIIRSNIVLLSCLLAACFLAYGTIYIVRNSSGRLQQRQLEQRAQINQLYINYTVCRQTAIRTQTAFPTADIPQQQVINSVTNRCQGIYNQLQTALQSDDLTPK